MSRSYKDTGIILKGMPIGETDRLSTILTVEHGLVTVIVPGARKHKSRLAGRSSQFVVNELFIVRGKRLDKLVQAETIASFPGLSTDLARLTASQYLAELVLCQALSEQPQEALFTLIVEQLQQLEKVDRSDILCSLNQGIFRLLAHAGVAPELGQCSVSQRPVELDMVHPDWQIGFSTVSGGVVAPDYVKPSTVAFQAKTSEGRYATGVRGKWRSPTKYPEPVFLSAQEFLSLRQLESPELITHQSSPSLVSSAEQKNLVWQRIERILRQYAEYHFDRPIRSAALVDTCFPTESYSRS